jgi:hypothetical protein
MKVIHFTEGAAEFFESSRVSLTKFVPLLQGTGETYLTCLHLLPGAMMVELPTSQSCALIVVSGFMTANTFEPNVSVELRAGVGVVIEEGEGYSLESREGAVVMSVNAERLDVSKEAVSTPELVMGQVWPGGKMATPGNVCYIFK